jgi:putative OPT family oligopeptide transporter
LKVGEASREGAAESQAGLRTIVRGAVASSGFALFTGMRFALGEVGKYVKIGPAATGIAGTLSLALVGAGHLVGLSVGLAMFAGLVIGWGIATPILTALSPGIGTAEELATTIWATQVRFLGAGVIGVAAIWTLVRIIGPIVTGIRSATTASRARRSGGGAALARTDRDMPMGVIGGVTLAALIPISLLLFDFVRAGPLADMAVPLILVTLVYILIAGAFIAAVCGYMAGLIGASNSPISGVGILAVIGAALLLALIVLPFMEVGATPQLTAYALFATAIVFGVATISNDNLQDLKTGQLVGATPWKQQLALIAGVFFGSLVIPPVLDLLNQAYGFAGAPGAGPNALPAPQATLISALARGVLGGDLDWSLIGTGALVGVAIIIVDGLLGRAGKLRLPPLAVGIGIYLPAGSVTAVVIGAVLGWFYDRRADRVSRDPEATKRMGVLMATGLIVGESLFGVAMAGLVVGTGSDTPLAVVGDEFGTFAAIGGTLVFAALVSWLYRASAKVSA